MARIALRIFIASISLSALLGVAVLLGGEFGKIELKILGTTLCVSGASILSMASAVALERGRARVYPWIGVSCSTLGFAILLLCILAEEADDVVLKFVATVLIAGAAGAHGSLLALAEVPPGRRWVLVGTLICAAFAALAGTILVWIEGDSEELFRALGALAVLTTAGTLIVPVLTRLGRREAPVAAAPGDGPHCPHCGGALNREWLRRALGPGSREGGRLG